MTLQTVSMSLSRGRSRPVSNTNASATVDDETTKTRSRRRASEYYEPPSPGSNFVRDWWQKLREQPDAVDEDATSTAAVEDETPEPEPEPSKAPEEPTDKPLSSEDLQAVFLGAPYFLLEKGDYGQWYPLVIFPYGEHDMLVQNLWDRKPFSHASFSLSTLHAHIPVPDGWVIKGDAPACLELLKPNGPCKRAAFDVGVFELPNMLSVNGKEAGSVGFQYFLEMPLADLIRYTGPEKPRARSGAAQGSSGMSTLERVEAKKDLSSHAYALCRDGTVHDRKRLLCEGPAAWECIGVRDPSVQDLVDRLGTLRSIRHDMLYADWYKTILDVESPRTLHDNLFSKFLHPPPQSILGEGEDTTDVKCQIRLLTTVLATPGAWVDFSLEEWRLRVGQLLWEAPPHRDGDCLNPEDCEEAHGVERKWLLLQMLLAGELLVRVDAIVHVGLQSPRLGASAAEIKEFDKMRDRKVNWDFIVVRRFFDNLGFGRQSGQEGGGAPGESAWECKLTPSNIKRQLQGLFVFAENIGWPGLDALKERLLSKAGPEGQRAADIYSHPVQAGTDPANRLSGEDMYSRCKSRRQIMLHPEASDSQEMGWITRSWLSGLIAPGGTMSQLLMATVLENDPDALTTLGPLTNLYGGFSLGGRSWWSKHCVVGKVLASLAETKESMGWIGSAIVPVETWTSQPLDGRWFEVRVKDPPSELAWAKPRIKQGNQLARQSTPLGTGYIAREAFSLPLDREACDVRIDLEGLTFVSEGAGEGIRSRTVAIQQPALLFHLTSPTPDSSRKISWPLTHNVHFISSYDCCPPFGRVRQHGADLPSSMPERVPGHPLHTMFSYRCVTVNELTREGSSSSHNTEVLVINARGSASKATFARAWCASTGRHAVIGRVGRTCLGCSIREARAVEVDVVIRVDGTATGVTGNRVCRPD